jgi:hypothetical protein
MIAAGQVVADSAACHPVERLQDLCERLGRLVGLAHPTVLIEQKDKVDRLGKLGPGRPDRAETEAGELGIVLLGQLVATVG